MITLERLKYYPKTGKFTRKGKRAEGQHPRGYLCVSHQGKTWLCHRLAWTMVNGEIPKGIVIDHMDGNPKNNRIANLRCVTSSANAMNRYKPNKDGKSGYLGVAQRGNKWEAYIQMGGKKKHLGYYDTAQEAARVRNATHAAAYGTRENGFRAGPLPEEATIKKYPGRPRLP